MNKRDREEQLKRVFIEKLPEFRHILDDELDGKDQGEFLAHILFSQLADKVAIMVNEENGVNKHQALFTRLGNAFEELLNLDDDYIFNLLYVSFLEDLPWWEPQYDKLKPFYGPKLLSMAEELPQDMRKRHEHSFQLKKEIK